MPRKKANTKPLGRPSVCLPLLQEGSQFRQDRLSIVPSLPRSVARRVQNRVVGALDPDVGCAMLGRCFFHLVDESYYALARKVVLVNSRTNVEDFEQRIYQADLFVQCL